MGKEVVTTQQRIGHAVRVLAREKRIHLTTIYTDIGMSKASFFERLSGKAKMSVEDLEKIAQQLGVGVGDLLARAEQYDGPTQGRHTSTWRTSKTADSQTASPVAA